MLRAAGGGLRLFERHTDPFVVCLLSWRGFDSSPAHNSLGPKPLNPKPSETHKGRSQDCPALGLGFRAPVQSAGSRPENKGLTTVDDINPALPVRRNIP